MLQQRMLSNPCCENNRQMIGMNERVKSMEDAVVELQLRALVEGMRWVVKPVDGPGS